MSDSNLSIPDSTDYEKLSAMRFVAAMKEHADKHGTGFIGGFVAPDGEKFIMSNLSGDDLDRLLPDQLK